MSGGLGSSRVLGSLVLCAGQRRGLFLLDSLCSSRVRLVRPSGQLAYVPWAFLPLQMGSRRRAFVWRRFRPGPRETYKRSLAVVEAREELHTQRRADGHERADEVDGERERGPVVRDVLGQAVPVVLAAPAHGQAADGAAGT